MDKLLSVLRASLKAKITPMWTRLKYWTSWSFIQTKIITKIREWFSNVLNIKPRHKKDYYQFLGLLISRRLAHAILLAACVVSLVYLTYNNPFTNIREGIGTGEKIYSYKSVPLRFAKGDVKIKAKSGYIAYSGAVEKGYASGQGELFDEEGRTVYYGDFAKNMYNGSGTTYYVNGQAHYTGQFTDNLYEGSGSLYRENGTLEYKGEFSKGLREGLGTLYDATESPIYTGSFRADDIVYAALLNKSSRDIEGMYTGKSTLYQGNDDYVVMMDDISAFYVAPNESSSIENELKPSRIFVGKDEFAYGTQKYTTITELNKNFGSPLFEGNSYITLPEAVGIEWLKKQGVEFRLQVDCSYEQLFDEVINVTDYTQDAIVYLYVYEIDGITYSFVSQDRGDSFFMYVLE